MFEKKFFKKVQLSCIVLLGTFVLLGCGGDTSTSSGGSTPPSNNGGTNSTSNGETNPPNNVEIDSILGNVELGAVKDASVTIYTLDESYALYSTTTDEYGQYKINIQELKDELNGLSSTPKYLKIVALGGTDIDPNDDGKIESSKFIEVKGKVVGLVSTQSLLEKGTVNINLISTVLAELLAKQETLDEETINNVLVQLNMEDINQDGKVTLEDVVSYRMVENDTATEESLRLQYLRYIHAGKENLQKQYVELLQDDTSFVTVKVTKLEDDKISVKFKPLNKSNTIRYATSNIDDSKDLPNVDSEGSYVLSNGTMIIYQECQSNGVCYKREKIYNNAGKENRGTMTIPNLPSGYADPQAVADLRQIYLEKKDIYLQFKKHEEEWKAKLTTAKKEKEKLERELQGLQLRLNNL